MSAENSSSSSSTTTSPMSPEKNIITSTLIIPKNTKFTPETVQRLVESAAILARHELPPSSPEIVDLFSDEEKEEKPKKHKWVPKNKRKYKAHIVSAAEQKKEERKGKDDTPFPLLQ